MSNLAAKSTECFEYIGRKVISFLEEAGGVLLLLFETARQALRKPLMELPSTFRQMYEIGVRSLPVVLITSIFTGMVLALQTYTGFKRFGAESMVGTVVALSMTREMGPVLTGLIVAGRAGAAMAAELGTMRVTEQIDALETLAVNPVQYLVVPRVLSGLIMLPALTAIADLIGIVGGFMVSVGHFGASPALYWRRTWELLKFDDITSGLVKAAFFGLAIAIICCYKGFYTSGGAKGVGDATKGSVVVSFMTILISDYFLTAWLF